MGFVNSRSKYFGYDPITRTISKTIVASLASVAVIVVGVTGTAVAIPGVPLILIGDRIHIFIKKRFGLK